MIRINSRKKDPLMQETITVTNAAELEAAVNATDGGEIIELAYGAYGDLTLTGTYTDTLTIRSANTGGATFESIIFNGAKQITVENVHIEADTNGSVTQPLVRVEGGSEAITVTGSELNGPADDVYSGIYAVHIRESNNIIIEDNNIHDVRNGVVVQSSDGTQIVGNNIDYLGNDAMKFAGVTNVLIEDNVGGGNVFPGEGAHLDFIQFQSADSTGITIRGNVYLGSSRANVQGIFLDDAEFDDVLIENNIIYTGMIRGINVTAGDNINVLNNTVLNIPGAGKATKIFLPDGAVKEGNIESSFRGEIIGSNLTVQNADPSDPFYVNDLFVNGTAGLGITLEDLQTITGSLAEEYGAVGRVAELLGAEGESVDPEPPTAEQEPPVDVEEPETPPVPVSSDVAVFLIDADTDTPIYEIVAGEEFSFDMSSYDNVNLMVATEVAGVESVKLSLDGGYARTESAAPFAVFGDNGRGDFFDGVDLAEGLHTISISAYSADGAKGELLFETDFSFTATDSNAAETPVVVEEPETPVEEPNEPPVIEEPETPVEEPVAEETPSENDVITVSSSAELSEALLNATGGEIIEVVNTGVNYEFGLYKNFSPDSMVTVRAEDPNDPATFHTVYMREGQNLTLDGLQFGSTPDEVADRSAYLTDIYMHDVTNVTITNSRFIGTADRYAETQADLVEDILHIRGGKNIEVSNNFISNSKYGMTLTDTVGITITDNEITKVQGDGIRLGGVQDVVIDGNYIHDFLSSSNQLIHDDMIQIWSKDTYTQTQNVQITNNILDQGEGEYSQGIFIGNEKTRTPDGVFDDDVLHVDLLIENNYINTTHLHAIALEGVDGAVVANNTIVENPEYVADLKARTEAAGESFNSSVFIPAIRANRNVENIEIIDNQVPRLIIEDENVVESGNGPNGIGADLANPVIVDGEPEAPTEPPVVVVEPETPVEEPETPVEPEVPDIQDFTVFLVDAETDEVLTQVTNGEELSFEFGQHDNVNLAVYSADAEVESIVLQLNGDNRRVENVEPYALFGDRKGDFADGIELGSGEFTLSVSGYSVDQARGEQLFDEDFTFSIA